MTGVAEREVSENLDKIVKDQRKEFQTSLLLPPCPLTGSKVVSFFKENGYLERLQTDVNSGFFRRRVRKNPTSAIKEYRGRVFQDTQWISIMGQMSPWETPVSEENTFLFYRNLYKGRRKKFPLNPQTMKGISTPDCMFISQTGPQDFRISKVFEITLANWQKYFKDKYEHFLEHKDQHFDFFAYTSVSFIVPRDEAFILEGDFRFAKVLPGSLERQEFEEFIEEISENLPIIQYATSSLKD